MNFQLGIQIHGNRNYIPLEHLYKFFLKIKTTKAVTVNFQQEERHEEKIIFLLFVV